MKICWAQTVMILLVIALGSLSMLSACGQKGSLYLPPPDNTKTKTQH
ncbi:MAG: LPS translocon maturation chaperone LptM [bacterium]